MLRSTNRVIFCYVLLALAIGAEGCQRGPTWNLAPVEGTVTKDGRPLHGIEVVFLADPDVGTQGPRASGITDEAGHYRLRIDNGDYGAVVGKHRVVVHTLEAPKRRGGRTPRRTQSKKTAPLPPKDTKHLKEQGKAAAKESRVPLGYGRFNETPLRIEVHPGSQVIDFEVKAAGVEVK